MNRMRFVRLWLPLAIIGAGLLVIVVTGASETGAEGGGLLISAGLSVWLLNWFFRLGVKGDRERDDEEDARTYFTEHGHWPDEAPSRPAPRPDPPHRHDPAKPIDSPHGRRRRR